MTSVQLRNSQVPYARRRLRGTSRIDIGQARPTHWLNLSRVSRCLCLALAGFGSSLWLLSAWTTWATAASTPLAPLPDAAQKLAAYDGYVVFSRYEAAAQDWHLMVWHEGSIRALPVSPRDMPFDASAGPDANDRPTVVYYQ